MEFMAPLVVISPVFVTTESMAPLEIIAPFIITVPVAAQLLPSVAIKRPQRPFRGSNDRPYPRCGLERP